jgi:methionine synthase II (cobalamin-independent)
MPAQRAGFPITINKIEGDITMEAPRGMATLIGSVPHLDPGPVLEMITAWVPEAPIWPQLPKRHWREGFVAQYCEGFPGLTESRDHSTLRVNRAANGLPEEMAHFYETIMAATETGDLSRFAISEESARGIPAARSAFSKLPRKPPYIKVQSTGPVSFALTIYDENQIPLYYDDDYADIVVQIIKMKSIWQIQQFKPYGNGIICFLDEPSLSSFGSSTYINVTRDSVVDRLSSVIRALQAEGAVVGVHVCGNSEWSILIDAGVEILNFDAYGYGESVSLYAERISGFLEAGGVIAWGIVPTSPAIRQASVASLEKKLTAIIEHLAARGVDLTLIWKQSMLTPSCGMGTMSEEDAERVIKTLGQLAQQIQQRIR